MTAASGLETTGNPASAQAYLRLAGLIPAGNTCAGIGVLLAADTSAQDVPLHRIAGLGKDSLRLGLLEGASVVIAELHGSQMRSDLLTTSCPLFKSSSRRRP